MDIVTVTGREVLERTKRNEAIPLPKATKHLTAGLDWAGNSGKIIANLLFKKEALCEAFTVSSAQNLTWEEVADIYTELIGAKFEWVDTETFMNEFPYVKYNPSILTYDRLFARDIDNTKVTEVTGLTKKDFVSIKDGIKIELKK